MSTPGVKEESEQYSLPPLNVLDSLQAMPQTVEPGMGMNPSIAPMPAQIPAGNQKARVRNLSANGPTVASQADDEKYILKFRDMKKKTKGLMTENDKLYLKLLKTQWDIKRAKMYKAILYERLQAAKEAQEAHEAQEGEEMSKGE